MFSCLTCNVTETLVRSFFQHYETWRIEKREKRINRLKAILDTYATQVIEGKRRTANNAESNNLGPNLISRSLENSKKNSGERLKIISFCIVNMICSLPTATSIPKTRTLLSLTQIHPDLITLLSEPIANQAMPWQWNRSDYTPLCLLISKLPSKRMYDRMVPSYSLERAFVTSPMLRDGAIRFRVVTRVTTPIRFKNSILIGSYVL